MKNHSVATTDCVTRHALSIAVLVVLALASPSPAVVNGQIETFTDYNGASIFDGGPSGTGDKYLRVETSPSGSYLGLTDRAPPWTGNYIAAGITAMEADFINFNSTPLQMRFVVNMFESTEAFPLLADGQWHHTRFGLSSNDLAFIGFDVPNLETTLSRVVIIGFQHQVAAPAPGVQPTVVVGAFGIDNIQVTPEPSAFVLVGSFLILTGRIRQRLR